MTSVVLVQGGWHDHTCWDPLRAVLDARGIPSTAVRLPLTRLDTDADVVSAAIGEQPGDVVEFDIGHSPFLSRPDLVSDLIADRCARGHRE